MNHFTGSFTLDEYLSTLEKWFSSVPLENATNEVITVLQPISNFQEIIKRKQKQVTFFGVFKAGKSTLLNAIIGREVLPSRVNRATGIITKINFASQISASIITQDNENSSFLEKPIFLEDLPDYVLLDVSGTVSKAPEGIKEVVVQMPLPLIQHDCILVDSPGLMDNPVLTERSYQEIEKSDLTVMVLRADELLSQTEREAAQRLHELLKGNVVFIVNRLDLVDESEQQEVLDWVNTSLKGLGNSLIGQPCVFTTDAKVALQRKTNNTEHTAYSRGLLKFEKWLQHFLQTPIADKVAVLSRLGVLETYLLEAQTYFQNQLVEQPEHQVEPQNIEDSDSLSSIKTRLQEFGDRFIKQSKTNAELIITDKDSQWTKKIKNCFDSVLDSYTQKVHQELEPLAIQTKVKIPDFDLSKYKQSFVVEIDSIEVASGMGKFMGNAIGIGMGAGSTLLGLAGKLLSEAGDRHFEKEFRKEALDAVEKTVCEILENITSESERYINKVEKLLPESGKFNYAAPQTSPVVEQAQTNQQYYESLISWCEGFRNEIKLINQKVSA